MTTFPRTHAARLAALLVLLLAQRMWIRPLPCLGAAACPDALRYAKQKVNS